MTRFRVQNYKSFRDSGNLVLSEGFNVIVGANNVGKTTLGQALTLAMASDPHRSPHTAPTRAAVLDPDSTFEATFLLERQEFLDLLIDRVVDIDVPVPLGTSAANEFPITPRESYELNVHSVPRRGLTGQVVGEPDPRHMNLGGWARYRAVLPGREIRLKAGGVGPQYATRLAEITRGLIYYFRAERFNLSSYAVGTSRDLRSDAENLAQVLNVAKSDTLWWDNFVKLVSTVLPEVKHVSVAPLPDNKVQILIWTTEPQPGRIDLAHPLAQSGSGVGQVLAILYVVLTSDYGRTIIVDEPQSFLHPGALRKLIEILGEFPQHQFIFTTHSPTTITASDPKTLLLVKFRNGESLVQPVDPGESDDVELVLTEVGVRLSDVFGHDRILWVEGQTEEWCYPAVLRRLTTSRLLGTKIIGLLQTGDLEDKHVDTALRVYARLSSGGGVLPPALGFVLDQESAIRGRRRRLAERFKDKVFLIPRRMYESYLLDSRAISAVISGIAGFRTPPPTPEEIAAWIEARKWHPKYIERDISEAGDRETRWHANVDAAKLLVDLFDDLSEQRVRYDKITHGIALTEWLVEHAPDQLRELAECLAAILGKVTSEPITQVSG